MFSPSGMYGFAVSPDGDEVFFHAQDFHRLAPGGPPPVLGESVEVAEIDADAGNRPQARVVKRLQAQDLIQGRVKSFDSNKGWGFISYDGGQAFLHASETMSGWLPIIGTTVEFFLGVRQGRPRACWVRPIEAQGTISF